MRKPSLERAKSRINDYFDSLPSNVYRRPEIYSILYAHKSDWKIAESIRERQFLNFLIDELHLTEAKLSFPQRNEIVYIWRKAEVYEVAATIRSNAFFSHLTAAKLHGVISSHNGLIYLNSELTKLSTSNTSIDQLSIDRTFKNHPRVSNNFAEFGPNKLYLLYSKNHNGTGLIQHQLSTKLTCLVTDLERTLIDIAVRPFYAKDPTTVLEIFRNSANKCNATQLLSYLRSMDFKYPYHQSIGFLAEKAGFQPQLIAELERIEKPVDFYLTYQIDKPEYSAKWRLFYPANLEKSD